MNDRELHKRLKSAPLPEEHEARERSLEVVRAAFDAREAIPSRRRVWPVVAAAAGAAVLAATLSPPGRALLGSVREAIGVEGAGPTTFALPAEGRLLVNSDAGPWIVQRDGSRRLLGSYGEAAWSPRGLFVVAARRNELTTLDPKGKVRWKLPRRDVRLPRWGGADFDTRIAYLAGSRLHVVAGDGTDDVDAGGMPAAARVAPAWWHGRRHVVAYADTRGRVTVYDADAGSVQFRTAALEPRALDWSVRARLLVVTAEGLVLYGPEGQRIWRRRLPDVVAATFSPDGRRIAVLRRTEVLLVDARRPRATRRVFAGAGPFRDVEWSPDGSWLLVGWPAADQWVFVRVTGARRIRALSGVSARFESARFPRVGGWCCAG